MSVRGLSARAYSVTVNSVDSQLISEIRKCGSNSLNVICGSVIGSRTFSFKTAPVLSHHPSQSPSCRNHKCHQSFNHQSYRQMHMQRSIHVPASPLSRSTCLSPWPSGSMHDPCRILHQSSNHLSSSSHPSDNKDCLGTMEPHLLVTKEMESIAPSICKLLDVDIQKMQIMAQYNFDGKGKSFRPMVGLLMAQACNAHCGNSGSILESQKIVAMVAEMVHTASLVHDDVIDAADTRRGKPALNQTFGQRQAVLTGDYILSQATIALAQTGNPRVIALLAQVLEDLVRGEFMQLGSKEDESERFQHYLQKTYKKTASLIANTCKSVAVLAKVDEDLAEHAFQYGKNLGIAFQLVDDLLDFVSSQQEMGKPTAADLKLGLATAPVLFASLEHKELQPMIMRRFSKEGDVEYARSVVDKSDGVEKTKRLAASHSQEAIKNLSKFSPSPAQQALVRLAQILLERKH